MSTDFRYELKFVFDAVRAAEVSYWLQFGTTARKVYPDRLVNSLYFDDLEFSSVKDNLSGVSDRRKFRLRWYEDNQVNENRFPEFELKIREGRLGRKINFPLPEIHGNLMELNIQDIMEQVNRGLATQQVIFDVHLVPTLQGSYFRSYYEDSEGVRITLDDDIKFYGVSPHQKLGESLLTCYPFKIMELKFPPSMKNKVSKLIKPLHIIPKRHSKYLVGLSMMRQAIYL